MNAENPTDCPTFSCPKCQKPISKEMGPADGTIYIDEELFDIHVEWWVCSSCELDVFIGVDDD